MSSAEFNVLFWVLAALIFVVPGGMAVSEARRDHSETRAEMFGNWLKGIPTYLGCVMAWMMSYGGLGVVALMICAWIYGEFFRR